MSKQWFVVSTNYRAELDVVRELQARGYDAYSPMETVWIRHARSKTAGRRPLFPRYVFVFMDPDTDTPDVRHTKDVTGLLGNSGKALPITESDVIGQLRSQETMGAFDRTVSRKLTFSPGQPVRIIAGPFTGFMAQIMEAKTGEKRVRVLFSLFGRASPMPIDVGHLVAA